MLSCCHLRKYLSSLIWFLVTHLQEGSSFLGASGFSCPQSGSKELRLSLYICPSGHLVVSPWENPAKAVGGVMESSQKHLEQGGCELRAAGAAWKYCGQVGRRQAVISPVYPNPQAAVVCTTLQEENNAMVPGKQDKPSQLQVSVFLVLLAACPYWVTKSGILAVPLLVSAPPSLLCYEWLTSTLTSEMLTSSFCNLPTRSKEDQLFQNMPVKFFMIWKSHWLLWFTSAHTAVCQVYLEVLLKFQVVNKAGIFA
jgi:hypothetical protein